MVRWPLQPLSLVLYSTALYLCWRAFSRNPRLWHLGPILAWLAARVVLLVVVVARVILYKGEPPLSLAMTWWANMVTVAGGFALVASFWMASRGSRG